MEDMDTHAVAITMHSSTNMKKPSHMIATVQKSKKLTLTPTSENCVVQDRESPYKYINVIEITYSPSI
jgi:hypothetical protein